MTRNGSTPPRPGAGGLSATALLLAAGCGASAPAPVAASVPAPAPAPPAAAASAAPEAPAAQVAGEPGGWQPFDPHAGRTPRVRTAGDLTVESPPARPRSSMRGRLRNHTEGSLSAGSRREWVGPEVPVYVQLKVGATELSLLDDAGAEGHLAFYRAPYEAGSCTLGGHRNCDYGAALYDRQGKVVWTVALGRLLSRPDRLEIQDVRYAGGVLYFNEACQSYSREAGGQCSSLVAYDPRAKQVLWRTAPLVSNGVFLPHQGFVITGYGFTAEPDHLSIVRRSDGKVVHRHPIPGAHDGLTVSGETLVVSHYHEKTMAFRMVGFEGDSPRLVALPAPRPRPEGSF